MKNEPLVYVIILNYNGYKDTIECVNSLKKIVYKNYKIVIVDNNSTDDSEKVLKESCKECLIIQTGRNLGYAGGNNIGINYSIENESDYICILNNDVVVEQNFLNELVKHFENNDNTAMVGPMICEYSNKQIIQSTGARVNLYKGDVSPLNNGKTEEQIKQKIIKCDYVGGACILVRRDVLEDIGLIPENYFLFFEETEWCFRAREKRYDVICCCDAKVKHKGSSSMNKVSGLSEYFMHRNRIIFEKRNANLIQLICFYVYVTFETIYRIVVKKRSTKLVNYYFDGLLNKVNKKYEFAYISKNDKPY